MNSRYLVPCQCGQSVPVETSQAGQKVNCTCGQSLNVPTLRGLKQLPLATESPAKTKRTAAWNPIQGLMFGSGMFLLIVAALLALFNYPRYAQAAAFKPSPEQLDSQLAMIEGSAPEELWDIWHLFLEHGLGDHEASPFVFAQREADRFRNYLIASALAAFVGAGLMVTSIVIRVPSRP